MSPQLIDLKLATAEAIKGNDGVEAAASVCRVGKTKLSDYQSLNHADSFMPVDVVVALERRSRDRTGWPHITQAICHQLGGTFVPLPDVSPASADLLMLLATHAREAGDVASAICSSVAEASQGGKEIIRIERAGIRKELRDQIAVSAAMLAVLDAMDAAE